MEALHNYMPSDGSVNPSCSGVCHHLFFPTESGLAHGMPHQSWQILWFHFDPSGTKRAENPAAEAHAARLAWHLSRPQGPSEAADRWTMDEGIGWNRSAL